LSRSGVSMSGIHPTLIEVSEALEEKRVTSRDLVERCLDRIADASGESARVFIEVCADEARAAADAMDLLRKAGAAPSPFAGIPVSIKDLFDQKGHVTRAGSRVLADAEPATSDAEAVARLRRAGFVVIGRTNMSEFAYSGVGLNPHFGTPAGIWNRQARHIPGGSSSGAAVSVADGMAHMGLGTDTGGSCRIPAAFNRLVGYKPSAQRVPTRGAVPLSFTLDSIGPLARSVSCCAIVDAIIAGEAPHRLGAGLAGIRFAVPQTFVLSGMDAQVAAAFERALSALAEAGAEIVEIELAELASIPQINAKGGYSAAESYAWHRDKIATKGALYDQRVRKRIEIGEGQSAADYIDLGLARAAFIASCTASLAGFDAMLCPTVPIVPPKIVDLDEDAEFTRLNGLCLRNPAVVNLLDGCSISVPMGEADGPPMGLMISALNGWDRALFAIAAAAETALRPA
jgi:aspartyl-tRNA(Asn)/glutamyl-tRNA(Gln) amidotransferase subunit A